jgi:hypothetical protein
MSPRQGGGSPIKGLMFLGDAGRKKRDDVE